MLQGGAEQYAEAAPWLPIFPGLAITASVFAFNLFGDSLRDVLDPKLRIQPCRAGGGVPSRQRRCGFSGGHLGRPDFFAMVGLTEGPGSPMGCFWLTLLSGPVFPITLSTRATRSPSERRP